MPPSLPLPLYRRPLSKLLPILFAKSCVTSSHPYKSFKRPRPRHQPKSPSSFSPSPTHIQQIRFASASPLEVQPQWTTTETPVPTALDIPELQRRTLDLSVEELDTAKGDRERVVILGSGWAGYTLLRALDPKKFQAVLISPRSYFVFTPLLASTSVGTLEFRTALEPIRTRRRTAADFNFIQGWANSVNLYDKKVAVEEAVVDPLQGFANTTCRLEGKSEEQLKVEGERKRRRGQVFELAYDKLVIGVGCYTQTFGIEGVKENAFFLKEPGDARKIRKRLLECFEIASLPTTPDEIRRQVLNFAIVGGGPTGIEFAAELHDIIRQDLSKMYPSLTKFCNVTVYDVAPKVLSMFDESLNDYAIEHFAGRGLNIKTSCRIEYLSAGLPNVSPEFQGTRPGLTLKIQGEEPEGVGMCVWSTGLMPNPFIRRALSELRPYPPHEVIFRSSPEAAASAGAWTIIKHEKSGSIVTNDRLRVMLEARLPSGEPLRAFMRNVFAIGDCAVMENAAYPATAQVASQKASWLAKHLNKGDMQSTRFSWRDLGIMAYLGNFKGIVQGAKGVGNVSGKTAWMLWRTAYLVKSMSWRNRMLICMYWIINHIFGRDISRF